MAEPAPSSSAQEKTLAFRNAVKLTLSLAAMLVVAIAVRVWLPRVLGPVGFGQLHFAESLAIGLFLFTTLGADVYIRKEIATRPGHVSEFLGGLLVVRAGVSLAVFGAMAVILSLMDKGSLEWRLAFLFGIGQVAFVLETTLAAILHANGTVTALSFLTASTKLIWGLAIVVGVTLGGGAEVVAVAFAVTEWAKAIVLFLLVRKSTRLELRVDMSKAFAMLVASLPFFLHFLSHRVYERVDVQMLSVMTTDREVGWYGASVNISTVGMVFLPVLSAVILPMGARIASRSVDELNEVMKSAVRLIVVLGGLSSLLLVLHAEEVVLLAFGDAYAPSVTSLQILAPIFPLTYVAVVAGTHLVHLGRVWDVTKISLIGLALNPSLNFVTIPWFSDAYGVGGGGAGAAIATVATEVWACSAMLLVLRKAAVDRRLVSIVGRMALTCAITYVAHLALAAFGLWSAVFETFLYVSCASMLGCIPVRELLGRVVAAARRRR